MSTDVAHRHAAIQHWDEGFQRLVTQTVLRPKDREATAAELALLAEQSVRTGLDPMSRQIYGIYRKMRGHEVMTLQVGIDGLRAIAERTGSYLGQSGPYWCGEDGEWRDVWFSKDPPRAAKVIVRKAIGEHIAETPAVAHFDEYTPMKDVWVNGSKTGERELSGLWGDKPALMIAKCAEALALRKAFPQDMSGLYTDDEMARVDAKSAPAPLPAIEVTAVDAPAHLTQPNAAALILEADDAGIDREALRKAAQHACGHELPAFGNDAAAIAQLQALTVQQGMRVGRWIDKKAAAKHEPSEPALKRKDVKRTGKSDIPSDAPPPEAPADESDVPFDAAYGEDAVPV